MESRRMFSTVAWTGGGDHVNWTDPLNWSGQALPGESDDVAIGAGASVQLNSVASVSIRSVDLSGILTISDTFLRISTWFADSTVNAGGTLNLGRNSGFSGAWGTNLYLHGTMNYDGGGFDTVGTLEVFPEGRLNCNQGLGISANTVISNQGSMSISGGDVWITRHGALSNSGMLVLSGPMHFVENGTPEGFFYNDGTMIRNGDGSTILDDGIIFGGSGELRIDQGVMQIGASYPSPSVGALKVADGAKFVLGGSRQAIVATSISLVGSAQLDLGNNDLILDYTGESPIAGVADRIRAARNGGAWTGPGITSSAARDNPNHNTTLGAMEATDYQSVNGADTTFDGHTIDSTAILVKYTYYGDTDFNGKVNFDDYVRTDAGFGNHRTGWMNGDFDGNGQVNFDDYVLIDLAFNTQSQPLAMRGQGAPRLASPTR